MCHPLYLRGIHLPSEYYKVHVLLSHTGIAVASNNFDRFETRSRSLYLLGKVQCTGNETTLLECRASELGDEVSCASFEVAGVFCPCK